MRRPRLQRDSEGSARLIRTIQDARLNAGHPFLIEERKNMKKPRKLSEAAAKNDVGMEVGRIVDLMATAQSVTADYNSLMHRTGRSRRLEGTERTVDSLDWDLNSLGHEYHLWYFEEIHGEGSEPSQYWIVSDWLAGRLAENKEAILLLADQHYVWMRHGCGYSIEDDLAFLDEPDDQEASTTTDEDLDKAGDDLVVDPSDC